MTERGRPLGKKLAKIAADSAIEIILQLRSIHSRQQFNRSVDHRPKSDRDVEMHLGRKSAANDRSQVRWNGHAGAQTATSRPRVQKLKLWCLVAAIGLLLLSVVALSAMVHRGVRTAKTRVVLERWNKASKSPTQATRADGREGGDGFSRTGPCVHSASTSVEREEGARGAYYSVARPDCVEGSLGFAGSLGALVLCRTRESSFIGCVHGPGVGVVGPLGVQSEPCLLVGVGRGGGN